MTPESSSSRGVAGADLSDAVRIREHGLSLIRRFNRWLIGGAVVIAGLLSGLTAHSFHAHAAPAATTGASRSPAPSSTAGDDGTSTNSSGLTAPSAPPAAAPAPVAPVTSGGS